MYWNCGAFDASGKRVPNKKTLRELLATDPDSVSFDKTAIFDGAGTVKIKEVPEGVTLSVVLPDPYRDRRFYASVTRKGEKVTVK
jgi:hypothetical protein